MVRDFDHIGSSLHQTLRDEKACRQLMIFARRPHHNRNTVALDPDLQRFLGGQEIPVLNPSGAVDPLHHDASDAALDGSISHSRETITLIESAFE